MQTQNATAVLRLEAVNLTANVGVPGTSSILSDLNFALAPGDRVALVGPSGAGKTSLLRLFNRLSDPTQGAIYLEEQNIQQIPVIELRQQVVLVPQESKLLGMTVQEALAYPLKLRGMATPVIQQRIGDWIEQLHLPLEWLSRTEVQLSVGQRQLVAIARALVIQPKVLLLDEPTSALDAGRGNHLLKVLNTLTQSQQMTILMANHQLDLSEQFCTRVLYLEQGRLRQDLPAAEINWAQLRESLIQAEQHAAQEWG